MVARGAAMNSVEDRKQPRATPKFQPAGASLRRLILENCNSNLRIPLILKRRLVAILRHVGA